MITHVVMSSAIPPELGKRLIGVDQETQRRILGGRVGVCVCTLSLSSSSFKHRRLLVPCLEDAGPLLRIHIKPSPAHNHHAPTTPLLEVGSHPRGAYAMVDRHVEVYLVEVQPLSILLEDEPDHRELATQAHPGAVVDTTRHFHPPPSGGRSPRIAFSRLRLSSDSACPVSVNLSVFPSFNRGTHRIR